MKKALLLASFCVVPALIAGPDAPCPEDRRPDCRPEPQEEIFTVESKITIPRDTPAEVRRAIRMELEESCNDMKKEFEMLDGVRVESKCLECGCGEEAPHAKVDDKCADCGKEDGDEPKDEKGCPCASKPKPKR